MLPMCAVGLQVVNFGEDLAQTTHVYRLSGNSPAFHQEAELRQDFLRTAESENGDQDRALACEHALNRGLQLSSAS